MRFFRPIWPALGPVAALVWAGCAANAIPTQQSSSQVVSTQIPTGTVTSPTAQAPTADANDGPAAGNYLIRTANGANQCLTVASGGQDNGAAVTAASCQNAPPYIWTKPPTGTGLSIFTNKCLSAGSPTQPNDTALQIWDCNPADAKQSLVYSQGLLTVQGQHQCVSLLPGTLFSSATLKAVACDSNDSRQQFAFSAASAQTGSTPQDTNTTQDANTTQNTNTTAASPSPTNPDPIVVPPSMPNCPLAATAPYIVSRYERATCVDVHDLAGSPFLQTYGCNRGNNQAMGFDCNGRITFPARTIVDSGITFAAATYCMAVGDPNATGIPVAILQKCSATDGNQLWLQSGNTLVHKASGLCLDVDPFAPLAGSIPLTACQNAPTQSWALADPTDVDNAFWAQAANMTVAQRCTVQVGIEDRSGNSAGFLRLLNLYGGSQALAAYVQRAILDDCALLYDKGADVPYALSVKLIIDPPQGNTAYTWLRPHTEVHIDSGWMASFNPTDAPLKFKVDAVLHHELTHMWQHGDGIPSGLVEGIANWVAYKAGYIGNYEKVKGGTWSDGYSTTAFFLLWLDTQFPPLGPYENFTHRLNMTGKANETSGNSVTPQYFIDQTGSTVDDLWARYQASF